MCGIAGVFGPVAQTSLEKTLWTLSDALKHRGPDAQQVWLNAKNSIGLVHTRLSIIDLDPRANQPMHEPETGCVLVFNGEIYNYLELRDELKALGHAFTTQSDSEVLLKAYVQWGTSCLERFNGMWAFALYDPREETLFCARDRLGVKPFCYSVLADGSVAFASELKALRAAYPQLNRPNVPFLAHVVVRGDFAAYAETVCDDVFNLQPAHAIYMKLGDKPQPYRYWSLATQTSLDDTMSDEAALAAFKKLLLSAITVRFRADVPVGACLSGGLDSGSIVGLATEQLGAKLNTFSCVYPQWPDVDESYYIRQTAKAFAQQAYEVTPEFDVASNPNAFIEAMQQSVFEQDGPTGGPTVLSQRAVMQLAGSHVRVLLDGQGGDEVLGGYHSYFEAKLQTMAAEVAEQGWRGVLALWQERRAMVRRTGHKFPSVWALLRQTKKLKHGFKRLFYSDNTLSSTLSSHPPFARDPLHNRMLEGLLLTLTNLLHYEDRNSMRFAIEARLPFLDVRLVEYAYGLSHRFKIREAKTKWLLLNTIDRLLPLEVVHRKDKMGFSTPGARWFLLGNTPAFISAVLSAPSPALQAVLAATGKPAWLEQQRQVWQRIVEKKPVTAGEESALWRLLTTHCWLELLQNAS